MDSVLCLIVSCVVNQIRDFGIRVALLFILTLPHASCVHAAQYTRTLNLTSVIYFSPAELWEDEMRIPIIVPSA